MTNLTVQITAKPVVPDDWAPLFLRILRNVGSIRTAAEMVGITSRKVRSEMTSNPAFAVLVNDSLLDATELLEASAFKRALEGDNLMTIFLLKGLKPEKYRDNYKASDDANRPIINVKTYVGFSPDDWDMKIAASQNPAQVTIDAVATKIEDNGGEYPDLPVSAPAVAVTTST